jgi:hypothetical protein
VSASEGVPQRILGSLPNIAVAAEHLEIQTKDPQKTFESFKTQIRSWTNQNIWVIAASMDDNVTFEQPVLLCEEHKGWSCSIDRLIGRGDHANYTIDIDDPNGGYRELTFTLRVKSIQHYDQYKNYSECEYQWLVDTHGSAYREVYFDIINLETKRKLGSSTAKLPSITFKAFTSPGQCEK